MKEVIDKNPGFYSSYTLWMMNEWHKFFETTNNIIFVNKSMPEIFEILKSIIIIMKNYESKGLSLTYFIERIYSDFFQVSNINKLINIWL